MVNLTAKSLKKTQEVRVVKTSQIGINATFKKIAVRHK